MEALLKGLSTRKQRALARDNYAFRLQQRAIWGANNPRQSNLSETERSSDDEFDPSSVLIRTETEKKLFSLLVKNSEPTASPHNANAPIELPLVAEVPMKPRKPRVPTGKSHLNVTKTESSHSISDQS